MAINVVVEDEQILDKYGEVSMLTLAGRNKEVFILCASGAN